ncbi:hypothetical protein BDV59DRAFT_198999 [Aspergillus ambiguus]|uniref:uncharacterized protein n=1 Tax=Aspergillus ambiguus TaxID=176160 RepID=UPI003CCD632D
MDQTPLSPPSEPASSPIARPVALDSPLRTTPIHALLPEVRVPREPLPSYKYDPVTCAPLEGDEVRAQVEELRREFTSPEEVAKAQEQAAREVKQKIEDAERKREEVQKAIDKKIKERNMEMKVLSKYQKVKASDVTS